MKKNLFQNFFLALCLTAIFAVPFLALGQTDGVSGGLNQISSAFGNTSQIGTARTLPQLILAIIRLMLMIAGMIAVVFVIVGGYMYVTSAGNSEQAEKGKNTLVNAIIGIIVIVLSYVIINVIVNFVSSGAGFLG